jgi:hypothetical protein
MQNTDKRPSTTWYKKKIILIYICIPILFNINKCINLYIQTRITRLEILNSVCYYYNQLMENVEKKIIIMIIIIFDNLINYIINYIIYYLTN